MILIYTTVPARKMAKDMAKQLLQAKGQEWTEIDIEAEPARRSEMIERSGGQRTVPQIFIGDRHVGGFDEMAALEDPRMLATAQPRDVTVATADPAETGATAEGEAMEARGLRAQEGMAARAERGQREATAPG